MVNMVNIPGWWWMVGTSILFFPEILGSCHHPNWRTLIFFQRGGYTTTNQISLRNQCFWWVKQLFPLALCYVAMSKYQRVWPPDGIRMRIWQELMRFFKSGDDAGSICSPNTARGKWMLDPPRIYCKSMLNQIKMAQDFWRKRVNSEHTSNSLSVFAHQSRNLDLYGPYSFFVAFLCHFLVMSFPVLYMVCILEVDGQNALRFLCRKWFLHIICSSTSFSTNGSPFLVKSRTCFNVSWVQLTFLDPLSYIHRFTFKDLPFHHLSWPSHIFVPTNKPNMFPIATFLVSQVIEGTLKNHSFLYIFIDRIFPLQNHPFIGVPHLTPSMETHYYSYIDHTL